MQKILYPEREKWTRILERPENKGEDLDKVCKAVFDEVRTRLPMRRIMALS